MMATKQRSAELRSVERAKVALERTIKHWLDRWPPGSRCYECGVTNPIALGGVRSRPLCYACKMRRSFEEHSIPGDHKAPRILIEANAHKIQDETQRIVSDVLLPGVRMAFTTGLAAWVATSLTALGTLEPGGR